VEVLVVFINYLRIIQEFNYIRFDLHVRQVTNYPGIRPTENENFPTSSSKSKAVPLHAMETLGGEEV
jgi:hypothetical protein